MLGPMATTAKDKAFMEITLTIVAVAIPLWLNVWATRMILQDALSERPQKIAQLLLVWLLPLLGAIVALAVHRKEEKAPGVYPAEKDLNNDLPASSGPLRSMREVLDDD